eukprot:NODE_303_length_1819_cov_851.807910_g245_i0.p1 GENE.NODE_303_length_1819_cov_851.807910_g245_i0~~NODE_303_length_1819_cov_851.807910_g245_i0.p1  ORF type:complete len:308 (-),score=45.65 NODE_303_length_1819_cov_851.807910_g245_i0:751-1674(-)
MINRCFSFGVICAAPISRPVWSLSGCQVWSVHVIEEANLKSGMANDRAVTQVTRHTWGQVCNSMPENLSPICAADFPHLLPSSKFSSRPCLVLDLDETLVHSSFNAMDSDLILPLSMPEFPHISEVFVKIRPGLEAFLKAVASMFEVVIFTASLPEYGHIVLDQLDPDGRYFHHRLFRDSCSVVNGLFVKDLSLLGRPLNRVSIIDNSPTSFLFQPRNSLQCTSWFDDMRDTELPDLLPLLYELATSSSAYGVLDNFRKETQQAGGIGLSHLKLYTSKATAMDYEPVEEEEEPWICVPQRDSIPLAC